MHVALACRDAVYGPCVSEPAPPRRHCTGAQGARRRAAGVDAQLAPWCFDPCSTVGHFPRTTPVPSRTHALNQEPCNRALSFGAALPSHPLSAVALVAPAICQVCCPACAPLSILGPSCDACSGGPPFSPDMHPSQRTSRSTPAGARVRHVCLREPSIGSIETRLQSRVCWPWCSSLRCFDVAVAGIGMVSPSRGSRPVIVPRGGSWATCQTCNRTSVLLFASTRWTYRCSLSPARYHGAEIEVRRRAFVPTSVHCAPRDVAVLGARPRSPNAKSNSTEHSDNGMCASRHRPRRCVAAPHRRSH